jgi:hypothetical protein
MTGTQLFPNDIIYRGSSASGASLFAPYQKLYEQGHFTGEYIVIEETGCGRHYLTLARHRGDDATLIRVNKARGLDRTAGGARITEVIFGSGED